MKKVIAVALIGFMAIGCSKSESPDPGSSAWGDGPMTFSAVTPGTRSYFPGSAGTMYWDTYDNIGAYSFGPDGSYLVGDFCAISRASAGTNEGSFNPKNVLYASSWFQTSTPAEGAYTFYAYYPQLSAPAATYADGGVLLNISPAQTGEFGKYQICCSKAVTMTKDEVAKNKSVRFAFSPASSMIRVRLVVDPESQVDEVYIKQVSVTVTGTALTGNCKLTFDDGVLAATEAVSGRSVVTVNLPRPAKVSKDAESNPYIDFVVLPAVFSSNVTFSAITQENVRLTIAQKSAPATGFEAGVRYNIDRSIKIILDDNSPDGSYTDGGNAWESQVDDDGAYTDGGFGW